MRHIFPIDLNGLPPDQPTAWLLSSGSGDWAIRALRLERGFTSETRPAEDAVFLILEGSATATIEGAPTHLPPQATLFVPAGANVRIEGAPEAKALEVTVRRQDGGTAAETGRSPRAILVDEARFQGSGFAYQSLIDRSSGLSGMKINVLRVEPGSGSPDFHIHAFDQMYFILGGEMQVDIGQHSQTARANSLVYLPAGIVHRNYNAGPGVERHFSFLVPEPPAGEIFDYATTIHHREAEIMTSLPATKLVRSA